MLKVKLGDFPLDNIDHGAEVTIVGKLAVEADSELAYLMMENSETCNAPSDVEGDIVLVESDDLIDKIFNEIPPLVGGIFECVLRASLQGKLTKCSISPFKYKLVSIKEAELVRDIPDDVYKYRFSDMET